MSEDSQLTNAAATGAAAAVAAVQDDQAEQERAASMENATVDATISAEMAAEQATAAAEAATAATEAAIQASETANAASEDAGAAAGAAYSAQDDIGQLRREMSEGWQSFRTDMASFLDERLGGKRSEAPTEVVVNDGTNTTAQSGNDSGSNGGTGNTGPGSSETRRRHKFGGRR